MICTTRIFILGPDDTLYRLAAAKFSCMLNDPESLRLVRFAGQRVRMAEVVVESRDRKPYTVVRHVYEMLSFDAEGRLDRSTFITQNAALAELAVDGVIPQSVKKETPVVNASSRFVAQGLRWQPSPSLERKIRRAALGDLKCERV